MDLSKIENLTDDQKKMITEQNAVDIAEITKSNNELTANMEKMKSEKKIVDDKNNKNQDKVKADNLQNATTLDDVKKLLYEERKSRTELEKRILDGEKERVKINNERIIHGFVDDFINKNVVNDSLVRDAIKNKISNRLGVRDGNVVELNGSELTGKTGLQVLDDIKIDKGYSNHLIANNARGGGATGGTSINDSNIVNTMTRLEFDSASPAHVATFVRDGGNIVD